MKKQVGNVQLMQKMNRLKVLNYIRQNPIVARPQIAHATGLSLASITNIISYLLSVNIVEETGFEDVDRVGRKSMLLKFNSMAYDILCVRVTRDTTEIIRTNLEGDIAEQNTYRIEEKDTGYIASLVKTAYHEMKKSGRRILAVGVDISALVLSDGEYILSSSLMWNPVGLKEELHKETGLPVFVENTSYTKAAWQFKCEIAKSYKNMIFVDLDGGFGAVQFYNGVLNRAFLGEIGHTTVEKDGEKCFCGNQGCLEVMCSIDRMLSEFNRISDRKIANFDEFAELCIKKDKNAERIAKHCGEYIGIGLANIVNMFNPDEIVINGAEYIKCDTILKIAEKTMRKRAYNILSDNLVIKTVSVNHDEIIKGIAVNLCDSILNIDCKYNFIE